MTEQSSSRIMRGWLTEDIRLDVDEDIRHYRLGQHTHDYGKRAQGRMYLTSKGLIFTPWRLTWQKHGHAWSLYDIEVVGQGRYPSYIKGLSEFGRLQWYIQADGERHWFSLDDWSNSLWLDYLRDSGITTGPEYEVFT